MLKIRDLQVSVDDNEILKGLDLTVNAGEVHAIMGPERERQEHPGKRDCRAARLRT